VNISVNEQPEWFHWAHRRWPFYKQNPDLQYLLRKKKKTCLPVLKNFPMLGETNNQFYLAL
jgi:hypothetical protein